MTLTIFDVESSYSYGVAEFEEFMEEYEARFMAPMAEMQLALMVRSVDEGMRELVPGFDDIEDAVKKITGTPETGKEPAPGIQYRGNPNLEGLPGGDLDGSQI